ncbi:AEC family transporter [Celeribacter litoreus]|uniref:AEC family transporter n=1 Tax=Celeribacter litoreus TaxID=2876714 RepID=UPI001CC9E97C|nr:AEC family transporter [Celeribacter litoreus]MCA0041966.1 AEC family transporter [Celeribacter litoreus]
MADFVTILGITFPIFALIALGFTLVSKGVFNRAALDVFSFWVMNIALPSLIFAAIASRSISTVFHPNYLILYAGTALIPMAVAFLWFSRQSDPLRRAVAVMVSACPNTGFIGSSIFLLVIPEQAGVALALNLLVENILLVPLSLVLFELARNGEDTGHTLRQRLMQVFIGLARRPLMIAIVMGLVFSALGAPLPEAGLQFFKLLGASAPAIALFVIGGSLVGQSFDGNLPLAAQLGMIKLAVMPLAAIGLILLFGQFGVELEPDLFKALLITSALPTMALAAVFAQEVGRGTFASLAILLNTLGAFISLNLVLYFVL